MSPELPPSTVAGPVDWKNAVLYNVYLRSFADASGDGIGDINGARSRLAYVKDLGANAIWFSPWYVSPMADAGYDVANYRDIDPLFGSLQEAEDLIKEAHDMGLAVLGDLVANHTSIAHPWFKAALAAPPGSLQRLRYVFADGRGVHGELPPTDWMSIFGGSAWSRITEPNGAPGQWYLHVFAPEQPDLNWSNDEVIAEFDDVMRFWFDRGLDGLRIDALPAMGKDQELVDVGFGDLTLFKTSNWGPLPFWDADGVHQILTHWRTLAREYTPERFMVGEVSVSTEGRLARYVRKDELVSAFAFSLQKAVWGVSEMREAITKGMRELSSEYSWPTWVLSSHDKPRVATRYSQDLPSNLTRGADRARAAITIMLALPGSVCIYQGDELGLPQVTNLPLELLEDPIVARTGDPTQGRDGCRVPMPWTTEPGLGFSTQGLSWLPQPASWVALSVEAQLADQASFLNNVRHGIALRHELSAELAGEIAWVDAPEGVLALRFTSGLWCATNFGDTPVVLPEGVIVLHASSPTTGELNPDTTVWLRGPVFSTSSHRVAYELLLQQTLGLA